MSGITRRPTRRGIGGGEVSQGHSAVSESWVSTHHNPSSCPDVASLAPLLVLVQLDQTSLSEETEYDIEKRKTDLFLGARSEAASPISESNYTQHRVTDTLAH